MQTLDLVQGSPEWLQARCGIVTCSEIAALLVPAKVDCFKFGDHFVDTALMLDEGSTDFYTGLYGALDILKSGESKGQPKKFKADAGSDDLSIFGGTSWFSEGAQTYMFELIAERITGTPAPSFTNFHTERGHEREPLALELYSMQTGLPVQSCGFIKNHGVGFSPDGLVNRDGINEVKSKLPKNQAEMLYYNEVPREHIAQCQSGLWVSEREWCDFIGYCEGMPLFIKRIWRDEKYIANLARRLSVFYDELEHRLRVISGLASINGAPINA